MLADLTDYNFAALNLFSTFFKLNLDTSFAYVQDISKKIRSAMMTKKRQGKFIGDIAPYGYEKDPADKNHLIVNEKYAPIIRLIFQMEKDGLSVKRISAILSEEKIRRPGAVAGDNHAEFWKYVGNGDEYHWAPATVRGILRNPTYKGSVIGNKSVKLAFRSQKDRRCSEDEIIIVDGMHEPIIEPDEWELVQSLITSRKRGSSDKSEKFDNIFCGLLFATIAVIRSVCSIQTENAVQII